MTDHELFQQALDDLLHVSDGLECLETIKLLTARVAQPEPEPFEYWNAVEGWVKIEEVRQHFDTAGCGTIYKTGGEGRVPLYTAPQREWVGLTDEDKKAIYEQDIEGWQDYSLLEAVEAKLKDKNI